MLAKHRIHQFHLTEYNNFKADNKPNHKMSENNNMSETDNTADLVTLSADGSQLVPLIAKPNSEYVDVLKGRALIRPKAFYSYENGVGTGLGKRVTSELIQSRFVYVGLRYKDQTSVPFFPVPRAKLYKKPGQNISCRTTQNLGDVTVEMCDLTHFTVMDYAKEAVQRQLKTDTILMDRKVPSLRTKFVTCALSHENMVRAVVGGEWYETSIDEALKNCPEVYLTGIAFVMPKYTRRLTNGVLCGEITLELYGMHITENVDEIFGANQWYKVVI